MAKPPALSTQLKVAHARIAELEKELSTAITSRNSSREQYEKYSAEVEQVHQVLDAVPSSIPRKSEEGDSWNRPDRTTVTRLAAWLAIRHTL